MCMSGSVESRGGVHSPSEDNSSSKKNKKQVNPTNVEIVEQGIASARKGQPQKVRRPPQAEPAAPPIDVKKTLQPFEKDKKQIIALLFKNLNSFFKGHNPVLLLKNLHIAFDKERHCFQHGDHIVFVSKEGPDKILIAGIAKLGKKEYFAKGGFGKIYPLNWAETQGPPTVFKLSQKKLKPKDAKGKKIPISAQDREKALNEGTSRGNRAKKEIEREIAMIHFITENVGDPTGLNVECYGTISFKNQVGYFTKRYLCDGRVFANNNQPAESTFHFMSQVMRGMGTLHALNLVHRDIKLANMLVRENGKQLDLGGGRTCPSIDAVITDFGNTKRLEDIFTRENPHPTLNQVIGNVTPSFVSARYSREIDQALFDIQRWDYDTFEYTAHVEFIHSILRENDNFALGIALYRLWTNKYPDFVSSQPNTNCELDPEIDRVVKMNEMFQEVYAASFAVSVPDENTIAEYIIRLIEPGLEYFIRTA